MRAGADGVELDVRLTADGVPVVAHDPDLARVTGGAYGGAVSTRALAALPRLDGGARVPTLEEALDLFAAGGVVNVELKSDVPDRGALVEASARALARARRVDVVISSFHPEVVVRAAARIPRVPLGMLVGARTRRLRVVLPLAMRPWVEAAHVEEAAIDAPRAAWLSSAGLRVVAWTVNDVERARALAGWGVRWMITDDPRALVGAFGPRPHSQSTRIT